MTLLEFQAQLLADISLLERQRIDLQAQLDVVVAQKAGMEADLEQVTILLTPPPPPPPAPAPVPEAIVDVLLTEQTAVGQPSPDDPTPPNV